VRAAAVRGVSKLGKLAIDGGRAVRTQAFPAWPRFEPDESFGAGWRLMEMQSGPGAEIAAPVR